MSLVLALGSASRRTARITVHFDGKLPMVSATQLRNGASTQTPDAPEACRKKPAQKSARASPATPSPTPNHSVARQSRRSCLVLSTTISANSTTKRGGHLRWMHRLVKLQSMRPCSPTSVHTPCIILHSSPLRDQNLRCPPGFAMVPQYICSYRNSWDGQKDDCGDPWHEKSGLHRESRIGIR